MECDSCGNKEARVLKYRSSGLNCDKCGSGKVDVPDVYFKKPYFDEHIAHPDKFPHGMEITSRRHKSEMMKRLGLRESGDKFHGAR